jgi:hypothetical protein
MAKEVKMKAFVVPLPPNLTPYLLLETYKDKKMALYAKITDAASPETKITILVDFKTSPARMQYKYGDNLVGEPTLIYEAISLYSPIIYVPVSGALVQTIGRDITTYILAERREGKSDIYKSLEAYQGGTQAVGKFDLLMAESAADIYTSICTSGYVKIEIDGTIPRGTPVLYVSGLNPKTETEQYLVSSRVRPRTRPAARSKPKTSAPKKGARSKAGVKPAPRGTRKGTKGRKK